MELWSDATATVVYDDFGLTYFFGDEVTDVCSVTGDTVYFPQKRGLKSSKPRFLAVARETKRAVVGESGEVPYYFDLTRKQEPQRLSFAWSWAAHLESERFLAVLPEDGKNFFRFVSLDGSGRIADEVELRLPEVTAIEPGRVFWEPPKSTEAIDLSTGLAVGPFSIQKNRFGLTAADSGTGLLLFAKPGEQTFTSAFRFPVTGDETLLACAVPNGIAVSTSLRRNRSQLLVLDLAGQTVFSLDKYERDLLSGAGVPFTGGDDLLCVPHSVKNASVLALDIKSWEIRSDSTIPGGSTFYDSVYTVDPEHVLISSPSFVSRLTREGNGWTGSALERKQLPKKISEVRSPIAGIPVLQLSAQSNNWSAAVGKTLSIEFNLSNTGGPSHGLEIELEGDALKNGLIAPLTCSVGNLRQSFGRTDGGKAKLSLPEVIIPPAHEKGAKRKKVEPAEIPGFTLNLKGQSPGAALLMVRLRTAGSAAAACGKLVRVL